MADRMQNISRRYRLKAMVCEQLGREAHNKEFKSAWSEIAIEWHALAARAIPADDRGRELIVTILGSWPINEVRQLVDEVEGKLRMPN
jgi:hypothetical protein